MKNLNNIFKSETMVFDEIYYNQIKLYLLAIVFTAGNILFPVICHLIPNGGKIFLPIYFFTIISSYKFGWRLGILTALMSVVLNHLIIKMPTLQVMPSIMVKALLLSYLASQIAKSTKNISLKNILTIVIIYQLLGFIFDLFWFKNINIILETVYLSLPGLIIQILGTYFFIKWLLVDEK